MSWSDCCNVLRRSGVDGCSDTFVFVGDVWESFGISTNSVEFSIGGRSWVSISFIISISFFLLKQAKLLSIHSIHSSTLVFVLKYLVPSFVSMKTRFPFSLRVFQNTMFRGLTDLPTQNKPYPTRISSHQNIWKIVFSSKFDEETLHVDFEIFEILKISCLRLQPTFLLIFKKWRGGRRHRSHTTKEWVKREKEEEEESNRRRNTMVMLAVIQIRINEQSVMSIFLLVLAGIAANVWRSKKKKKSHPIIILVNSCFFRLLLLLRINIYITICCVVTTCSFLLLRLWELQDGTQVWTPMILLYAHLIWILIHRIILIHTVIRLGCIHLIEDVLQLL